MKIYNRHAIKIPKIGSKLSAFLFFVLFLLSPSNARATDMDSSIIKEALQGIVCDRNIHVIIEGAYFQSMKENDRKRKPERHFADKNLKSSLNYIQLEQKKVLNAAIHSGSDPEMRTRALFHFGMMAHTANNFYSNTNYLPEKIKYLRKTKGVVNDPYNIKLVDWSQELDPNHSNLSFITESDRKKIFSQKLGHTTVARVARGLAIREIRRQWDFMEALIRVKYKPKASIIIAALKKADCEDLVPKELEGLPLHAHHAN